jgi:hypothetical protein
MSKIVVFSQEYSGEGIIDIGQDVDEAFHECYNSSIKIVPKDEYGLHEGIFVVTIEWKPDVYIE